MKNFRDLDVYKLAYKLAIDIHKMSLTLPKYEKYEQGSQIRRSSKSVKDNIDEGYGCRRYKQDFIKFLVFSHTPCNEVMGQLDMISDIHFPNEPLVNLQSEYFKLSKMIFRFIEYADKNWNGNSE